MNRKRLNEYLYANIEIVGTKGHCKQCSTCHILESSGLNPLQADEVWCYIEENGYKYDTIDFFEVYAGQVETHTFINTKVMIVANPYAENGRLPHTLGIDVVFKM